MRITRKGYYEVYDPDGNYISRHTSRDESYEAVTEHGQEGIYTITCPNREVEVLLGVINQGGGSAPAPSGDYTATHYVAPFASAAGSPVNDEDVQTAQAFIDAQSSGTPCTLGCAMANADAGHSVQVGPGVYEGINPETRLSGTIFYPVNGGNGTAQNPIIFFAEFPAAYNRGNSALWSELRTEGIYTGPGSDGPRSPVLRFGPDTVPSNKLDPSTYPCQYVIMDGFYANEALSRSGSSQGLVNMNGTNHCEVRRWYVERIGLTNYEAGGQGHSFWAQGSGNCRIVDCYFKGDHTETTHSCMEFYNTQNLVIEHCVSEDNFGLVYWKAQGEVGFTEAEVLQTTGNIQRYTLEMGTYQGLWAQTYREVDFYHNVIWHRASDPPMQSAFHYQQSLNAHDQTFKFWNNTAYIEGLSEGAQSAVYHRPVDTATGGEFYNNIVYIYNAPALARFFADGDVGDGTVGDVDDYAIFNHNLWFTNGASSRWARNSTNYSTHADFEASLTGFGVDADGRLYEQDSVVSDPEFVDAANGDFRLANNAQAALTMSRASPLNPAGNPVGAYVTGSEEIGLRASPTY